MASFGSIMRSITGRGTPPNEAQGPPVEITEDDARQFSAYGATGTLNWKGFLQPSEYVPELQGLAAIRVWERMRRSDPSVRETLWHIFGPVINAVWTVEPPDDPNDEEREQAAMVNSALFEWLEQPWTEVLEHVLSYLTFGHSVAEVLFMGVKKPLTVRTPVSGTPPTVSAADTGGTSSTGQVDQPPMPPDTETTVIEDRMWTTWRKFSPRLPATLWQWHVNEFGDLVEVTQNVWKRGPNGEESFEEVTIPAANLLVFTHEKWGDEYTGISVLRSAYKPWVMKEMIEKVAAIAYERHGVGYLIGYVPSGREQDDNLRQEMLEMLLALKQDAVAVMPGPKQAGQMAGQGYLIEILTPPSGIPDFDPILKYFRSEIAGAMLSRFKELGHSSTGARATADVQSAVWYNALHAVARYIESVFNDAIEHLVDENYKGVQRYPKLKAAGIESRNLLEYAQSMALLVDAGLVSPDLPTRQWARTMIDAPREDLQETRARAQFEAEQQQQQADQELEQQTQLAQVKASIPARGNETSSKQNGGRPRVSNSK